MSLGYCATQERPTGSGKDYGHLFIIFLCVLSYRVTMFGDIISESNPILYRSISACLFRTPCINYELLVDCLTRSSTFELKFSPIGMNFGKEV